MPISIVQSVLDKLGTRIITRTGMAASSILLCGVRHRFMDWNNRRTI
jgi:hypothetical protein